MAGCPCEAAIMIVSGPIWAGFASEVFCSFPSPSICVLSSRFTICASCRVIARARAEAGVPRLGGGAFPFPPRPRGNCLPTLHLDLGPAEVLSIDDQFIEGGPMTAFVLGDVLD